MKKALSIFVLFISFSIFSQQDSIVKVEINASNLTEALNQIEKQTNYTFFYKKKWLDDNIIVVNEKFEKTTVAEILKFIFKDTDLNFYLSKNQIILTQNSVIYDKVATNFIEKDEIATINIKPILIKETQKSNTNTDNDNLIVVGKESVTKQKVSFEISGFIMTKKNGSPVADANIRIQKKVITTTNHKGFYKLMLPYGKHSIEIEAPSHKKTNLTIVVYGNGTKNFQLDETITELNEVIIEGSSDKNIKSITSGVTSINMEDVKNVPLVLGERDILKVATTLPGIKSTGEGAAGVNVRGGKEDQNLFLLDNATIYNPSHFFGFFSSINPYVIKNAEIYKGSIPAEFGGRLSSVFDIKSKNGNSEKISGEGGIGPVTSNLSIGTPLVKGKSSILLGGRATYSDWILKQIDNPEIKNSKASFYDLILKYNHQFSEKTAIESTVYYSKDKFNLTSDSTFNYSNRIITLNGKHSFNEKNKAEFGISNSEYKFGINFEKNNQKSFDFGFEVNETKLIYKGLYNYNNIHKFTYGLNSTLYNISPGTLTPTDENSLLTYQSIQKEKGLESSLFITDNITLNKKLIVGLGLRYTNFMALGPSIQRKYIANAPITEGNITNEIAYKKNKAIKTYNGLEYRIALRQLLSETISVKLSFDTNYQYLHKLSTNTTQSPTDTWKLADLNIKPSFGQQVAFGVYKNFKGQPYEISLETYYKKSKNILDYKIGAELILNEHIETEVLQGKGKSYGIEFLVKKTSGSLNGWIGYSYSKSLIKLDSQFNEEIVNNGDYFPTNFDKPHDLSVILNYKFTKRYSLSTNFIYQTGRPITYPIGSYEFGGNQYILYSDRNEFRVPDYYRLDIGFNVEGNHKIKKLAHSYWNISIYNVLGRNNPYSVYFVTEQGKVKSYQTSIFSIPIPTITYNFKF
ncbi:TonB-dependent receptor plug domain-containing protein [Flavobacterium cucumis]|uniref:CarboxypepD_reg-like domain-containing protein n=1 Tax=Flavobacterium cucumis TaxID=416016 RepID=A0A1M7ZTK7_9FLAO|nr:TonB-dependent receptor plug domain-containing protein [Flavobacterium cucumis]SHO71947.1 CarboxypepD_reg-like domain-containing protein [Flavobacterium cucumis]